MEKALFLDLDDTVRTSKTGKPPNEPSDQVLMPNRKKIIHDYKKKGYKIIAVTNQGGIGLGYLTKEQCQACLYDINEKLDMAFDLMLFAPHKPDDEHYDTKPNPGMLLKARHKYNINMKDSIMVGDRDSDKLAAERAGVPFKWAKDFFGDKDAKS